MATCTSCYRKVRVRSLPDPAPAPKTPAGVKTLLKKKAPAVGSAISQAIEVAQALDTPQTILGDTQEQQTGRTVQVQTLAIEIPAAPAPQRHTVRPLVAREVIGNCRYCGKPLREKASMNVLVDEHDRLHSTCFLTKIILESDGDLQAAALQYSVPLDALQRRVQRLRELGWKLPDGVLN